MKGMSARALVLGTGLLLLQEGRGVCGPSGQAARTALDLYVPPSAEIPLSEPPPFGEKAPEARRRKLAVTVVPLPSRDPGREVDEATQNAALKGFAEQMKRNERLDMKDLETRLLDFSQEQPLDQIELARSTLQKGQTAMLELELDQAIAQLEEAVDQLAVVLPYIKKQELADAMLQLAVAHAQKGKRRASNAVLIRLLTWRPDFEVDENKVPPQIVAQVEEARRAVQRQARGEIQVESTPPGVQVFVDGRAVGVTPTKVDELLVGEHYLTFRKLGYKKGLRVVQVSPKTPGQVNIKMLPSEKYLLVQQAIAQLDKTMGRSRLDPVVDTLRDTLLLDQVVFLRLRQTDDGRAGHVVVQSYLYDLRTRLLMRQKAVVLRDVAETQGAAEQLYAGLDYDAVLTPPPEPPPPPKAVPVPIYRKWWFLTAASVIGAGVAATALSVALTRPEGCPSGNLCTGGLQF